ncbi:LOW QUALITY PROTEIN: serine--tRNA synthetase-like protein Slimp [Drosophila sulfurigaster albostrigata]|uniref:LOW QUALITY PROTEIN: serine--tRNA synthetase-like protein Slimp n=1 Tax=Drosophila sulfurigaster albostrigata TaxID=89887 RepID=UPI002D218966|nr:LOW QUALITY PROTEIN: serine--tRNA synthetase-like protein Slimp [Drosophila sulfurigaster albostrigata]
MLGLRRLAKTCLSSNKRYISALYITGDKANENYVTLQPYLDFAGTFRDRPALEQSIASRGLGIELEKVLAKFAKYQTHHEQLHRLDEEREAISKELKTLSKSGAAAEQLETLRERGKALRNDVKALKQQLYPIEDDFIHDFLHLPNALHPHCPAAKQQKLIYRHGLPTSKPQFISHLEHKDLVHFIDNQRYYLMEQAAHFDFNAMQALASYLVSKGDFVQTSNPDFVRCVLLEANATPMTDYHQVKEEHLQNKLNVAYLTGGGAFESFLGAMTKLCIYPSVLPLRYVACGRSYNREEGLIYGPNSSLYTATQTNAVQSFVATLTAEEADAQMEQLLNLAINFYKALDVPFQLVYAPADSLTPAESLRASLEVYAPSLKRYVCVGRISNYGDFVSKRILFSSRREKNYDFLHLIGGPVLYTTRLLAALIELGIDLDKCKLLGRPNPQPMTQLEQDLQEFKDLFK